MDKSILNEIYAEIGEDFIDQMERGNRYVAEDAGRSCIAERIQDSRITYPDGYEHSQGKSIYIRYKIQHKSITGMFIIRKPNG